MTQLAVGPMFPDDPLVDLIQAYSNLISPYGQTHRALGLVSEAPPVRPPDEQAPVVRMRVRRLDPDQVAELVERYQVGDSVPVIVKRFGIDRTTVLAHLRREGVARRPAVRAMTDAQVAEAARLYGEGWSLLRTGREFGVSDKTLIKEFRKAGVPTRPRR